MIEDCNGMCYNPYRVDATTQLGNTETERKFGMKDLESAKRVFFRRMFLIAYDISVIVLSSFLALLVRFELIYANIETKYLIIFQKFTWVQVLITLILFYIFRLYHSLWAYAGFAEVQNIISSCFLSDVLYCIFINFIIKNTMDIRLPYSYYCLYGFFLVCFVAGSRIMYRYLRQSYYKYHAEQDTVSAMIVGAGEAGNVIMKEIVSSKYLSFKVKCAIDDSPSKIGNYIQGIKIVGNRYDIPSCVELYDIKMIIIAMPTVSRKEIKEIVEICQNTNCEIKILPGIYQFMTGEVSVSKLRNVEIEDLLGREPVQVNLDSVSSYVYNKTVLITGAGGSIGSELCRQIVVHKPKQLVLFDIYENTTYDIQQELISKYPELELVVIIGSVCNRESLVQLFDTYHPEIVYHAAAHKHVPLMEDSPNEAVKNNVFGTLELAKISNEYNVKKFVLISTDKAVNPTNIMGATKRICEMMIQYYNMNSKTEYVAVRFGNVLGSNGSVIPLFRKQIEAGGPVTVTHPDIIRYFMTIPEAVALVLEAGAYAKGGEIFILDMGEPVKILDLATKLIRLSGYIPYEDIKIKFTGLRPGEKLYEELLMDEEGMQDTQNKMIHIGKPIEMDYDHFYHQLEVLRTYVDDYSIDIRSALQKIVATYNPNLNETMEEAPSLKEEESQYMMEEERKAVCTN